MAHLRVIYRLIGSEHVTATRCSSWYQESKWYVRLWERSALMFNIMQARQLWCSQLAITRKSIQPYYHIELTFKLQSKRVNHCSKPHRGRRQRECNFALFLYNFVLTAYRWYRRKTTPGELRCTWPFVLALFPSFNYWSHKARRKTSLITWECRSRTSLKETKRLSTCFKGAGRMSPTNCTLPRELTDRGCSTWYNAGVINSLLIKISQIAPCCESQWRVT